MTPSSLLVEPWTYNYLNSHYTSNNHANSEADIESFQGTHTTTVTWDKALAFLDDAASKGGQFYMQVAPGVYLLMMIFVSKLTCASRTASTDWWRLILACHVSDHLHAARRALLTPTDIVHQAMKASSIIVQFPGHLTGILTSPGRLVAGIYPYIATDNMDVVEPRGSSNYHS